MRLAVLGVILLCEITLNEVNKCRGMSMLSSITITSEKVRFLISSTPIDGVLHPPKIILKLKSCLCLSL